MVVISVAISVGISIAGAILASFVIKQRTDHHSHLIYAVSFLLSFAVIYYAFTGVLNWYNQIKPGTTLNDIVNKMKESDGDILNDTKYVGLWNPIKPDNKTTTATSSSPPAQQQLQAELEAEADEGILF